MSPATIATPTTLLASSGRLWRLCGLLLLLGGCTELALSADEASGALDSEDLGAGGEDLFQVPVRLDVQPLSAPDVRGRPLLPQTFWLEAPEAWTGRTFTMRPTVRVTGTVTGFAANPYGGVSMAGPTVPGSDNVPVIAQVELYQAGSVAGDQAVTDEDGFFELLVPAGADYRLVVRPTAPAALPMLVYDGLTLTGDVDLSTPSDAVPVALSNALYLDYGDPVVGRVLDGAGEPVAATVRLIDLGSGEAGPSVETDAQGYYFLRAQPGSHYLQVSGDGVVPTTGKEIRFEADVGGVQLDFNLGALEPVFVSGTIRSPSGEVLDDALVRLTSRLLSGAEGVLVVEDETNSSGEFTVQALPGEWTVEIIPPNEAFSASSPLEFDQAIGEGDQDLGTIALPPKVALERRVLDVFSEVAPGVVLTFYQQGFNGATYNTQTDSEGLFSLDLPDVPLTAYLTPTASPASAITRRVILQPSLDSTTTWALSDGAEISGSVVVQGLPEAEAGSYVIEARDEAGLLLGSLLTSKIEDATRFALRVDLNDQGR